MKLFDIMEGTEILKSKDKNNIEINKICYNSKDVELGDVFVCIKGYQVDGHKYINNAIEQGAKAVIVEDFDERLEILQFKVENTRIALARMGDNYYGHPSKKMTMIGITATNGKTTTSFMLDKIIEDYEVSAGLIGTVAVKYGDFVEPAYLTTPESLDLQKHLYNMDKAGVSHVCMEASSSAMELHRIEKVDFDIVSLHNIGREHIDLHGSFEAYYEAKSSIVKNIKENGFVILNEDDDYSIALKNQTKGSVITYSVDFEKGNVRCKNLDLSSGKAKFDYEIVEEFRTQSSQVKKGTYHFDLGTPGYHSVHNSMVAITMGILLDIPMSNIQKSMKNFTGVERRFEMIYDEDIKIIDDHFANSGNIDVTLKTLSKMDYDNVNIVYAIRGSRGVTVISEASEKIVEWSKKLGINKIIASLSKSNVTWKDEVLKEEIEAFDAIMKKGNIEVLYYDELKDAIVKGYDNTKENDILLLAGCQGMDDGARIALEYLYENNPSIERDDLFKEIDKRDSGL